MNAIVPREVAMTTGTSPEASIAEEIVGKISA
jgi:hypothetical protein